MLSRWKRQIRASRIPFISDLCNASWSNWREAIKEVIVIAVFSLMPVWLGIILVMISSLKSSALGFLENFASSSNLGILSASLLGPLLYMMFREEGEGGPDRLLPRFPSGLWFIVIIVICCVVASVIYSFTYLSAGLSGAGQTPPILYIRPENVALLSWILFGISIALVLFAATIRNSVDTQPAPIMSRDTGDYVDELKAVQGEDE